MKYNFKSRNINQSFHAFGQIEGQKEKIIDGLSVFNVLCDYYNNNIAREIVRTVEYGKPEDYAALIQIRYDSLTMEDCLPDGNLYYCPELNMYLDVYTRENKAYTRTVMAYDYPKIVIDNYTATIIKGGN